MTPSLGTSICSGCVSKHTHTHTHTPKPKRKKKKTQRAAQWHQQPEKGPSLASATPAPWGPGLGGRIEEVLSNSPPNTEPPPSPLPLGTSALRGHILTSLGAGGAEGVCVGPQARPHPNTLQSPGPSPADSGRNGRCLGNRGAFDLIIHNRLSPSVTLS